jgi:hypothetical protein
MVVEMNARAVMTDNTDESGRRWHYQHFRYTDWEPRSTWVSLAYKNSYTDPLARQFFWQQFEAQIRTELEHWQKRGWEPIEAISPSAFELRSQERIDARIDMIDVIIWIATLGLALLVTLILGDHTRRYMVYEPSEFRILMRRPVAEVDIIGPC